MPLSERGRREGACPLPVPTILSNEPREKMMCAPIFLLTLRKQVELVTMAESGDKFYFIHVPFSYWEGYGSYKHNNY